jgi:O-antigen ligase
VNEHQSKTSWVVWLVIVYLAWIETTPENSNRLAFLGEVRFERILAAVLVITVAISGHVRNLFNGLCLLTFLFFAFAIVSSFDSPYFETARAEHWRDNYWKRMVLFVSVAAGLHTVGDVRSLFKGIVYVVLLYEVYSWFDFLRGGSYVYQQGMRRMVGVWSAGGYGAANSFASMALFALPFGVWYLRESTQVRPKIIGVTAVVLHFLSILFSGTRGALVVAVAYSVFCLRSRILQPPVLLFIALLLAVAVPVLPHSLKHRYWDQLVAADGAELSGSDKMAFESGKGRVQGLLDGLELAWKYPFLGCGPGASAYARDELPPTESSTQDLKAMQLHNLYGQVFAETGFVGGILWLSLVGACIFRLWSIHRRVAIASSLRRAGDLRIQAALAGLLFVHLAYGMFAHTLYHHHWLVLFGCTSCLWTVVNESP